MKYGKAILTLLLLAAAWAGGYGYGRWYGPRVPGAAGVIARACRAAAMALLVVLLGWPALARTSVTVLPGEVAVAIDTSASMARADGPGGEELRKSARHRQPGPGHSFLAD